MTTLISAPEAAPAASLSRPLTLAHDYFTQRGGAERVAAGLIEALQPERVVTAVLSTKQSFLSSAAASAVESSFLQRFTALRRDPRSALPMLPLAWRLLPPVTEGTLLCSSSGWSHLLRVSGSARKVVYCHNPARWLYQTADYFSDQPLLVRAGMRILRPALRHLDRGAAGTADLYIANSSSVAERVRQAYGRESVVLHPPVMIDSKGTQEPVQVAEAPFFLTVGRGRGYKNLRPLLSAFAHMPEHRLVIVGSLPAGWEPTENVTVVGDISDAQLRWLYAHCLALMSVAHEDFGLTPLEANAFGAPALVLRAGGFLDSLQDGVSGTFIDDSRPASIVDAVRKFDASDWDSAAIRAHAAEFSMDRFLERLIALLALLAPEAVA